MGSKGGAKMGIMFVGVEGFHEGDAVGERSLLFKFESVRESNWVLNFG